MDAADHAVKVIIGNKEVKEAAVRFVVAQERHLY